MVAMGRADHKDIAAQVMAPVKTPRRMVLVHSGSPA
jgi:hypothetical protein